MVAAYVSRTAYGPPAVPPTRWLAKAELWLALAVTAERWGRELDGAEPSTLPPADWGTRRPHGRPVPSLRPDPR